MTTPRTKPIDLTAPQSRHLSQHRRLLVVIPCVPQPPSVEDVRKLAGIDYHWMRPEPDRGMDYWRVAGPIWAVRKLTGIEPQLRSPYQPRDIVPCREPWSTDHAGFYPHFPIVYEADGAMVGMEIVKGKTYSPESKQWHTFRWHSANRMPSEFIRHRPVVESVECRRVGTITDEDAESAAFGESRKGDVLYRPVGTMMNDWHRRYRRRGEAYSFDKAWGFFTVLVLKGE